MTVEAVGAATSASPRLISVVMPVYNEAENVPVLLRELDAAVQEPAEFLLVYDFPEDSTLPAVAAMQPPCPQVRLIHNTLGKGVLNAIKAGFQAARGDVVLVMMSDRSDEPGDVPRLAALIRSGADVAVGSRYTRGGRQIGGPLLKRTMSRAAGLSLHYLAGLPCTDATNNFRAYSPRLVACPIEVTEGFSLGMELTLKAHWRGWRIAEIPTTWHDRTAGASRFRLWGWMPHYLYWYFLAFRKAWLRF